MLKRTKTKEIKPVISASSEGEPEFYSWECVSLTRPNSTLDLVIKDQGHMMAFLNVLGRRLYRQTDDAFLQVFKKLRFKMKLGYECWRTRSCIKKVVLRAIRRTVREKKVLATVGIQKFLYEEDGAPSFSKSKQCRGNNESDDKSHETNKQRKK